MQLGVFISLVPMSKIRKNAMFLSLWSPGSTAGLYDMCNLNFRQTLEQTILMCAFLHWILAVCNVYWILRLCWPYLFSRHWWQSYGLENAVLLAAFSLDPVPACCGSAQQCPCCTLEPRATCLTTHVEVRFPRCVHMSHKPHANTHRQHLSKYHENKWERGSQTAGSRECDLDKPCFLERRELFLPAYFCSLLLQRHREHTGVNAVLCMRVSVTTVSSQFYLLSTTLTWWDTTWVKTSSSAAPAVTVSHRVSMYVVCHSWTEAVGFYSQVSAPSP